MARMCLILDDRVRFLSQASRVENFELQDCGILSFVISKKAYRLSKSLSDEKLYDARADLATRLPALTYPVFHPVTKQLIAVFQVVLWREGIELLKNEFLKQNLGSYLTKAANFEAFFGFQLASFLSHNSDISP